ncbi:MAG: anaerobic ribonucleoside-triphosphate reductase, partial [Clostridia bacterium]|nr:anaerobic ribonucleoside-triphosphate reductase [Clostridia bacterium]
GNIANISINLPRLALEVERDFSDKTTEEKIGQLKKKWKKIADLVTEILIDRYNKVCSLDHTDFPVNSKRQMWCVPFQNMKDVFKHGTLSVGFIGLSETVEIITGNRFYADRQAYEFALDFVKFMREYCDAQSRERNLNFSLLATSGELISGRFPEIDRPLFPSNAKIFAKGFYTNSFHVNVDSGVSAREKLREEGPFHSLSNGGSISYIELNEAPIGNDEGLRELIEEGIAAGVRYLGVNFPLDSCNDCHSSGVFDICPVCGSKSVTHIRRVSGYLEILDGFTNGKKHEVKTRTSN